jgi:4-amino-4-deoxy-L-arabinose transferase-like glycosyltransferase
MAITATLSEQETQSRALANWSIPLVVLAGFLLRLRLSWLTFLNPDEALHYFLSHQPSLKLAYEASLTTAHPPLMILFLHLWSRLGSSELFLRLPFVLAGTLFCWMMFLWVEEVASKNAAWFALALFLFAPSLISLSAEIRQYSFLLLFCACSLYSLERALTENSTKWIAFSTAALYLALLTHYSGLIFAAATGIYALSSLPRSKPPIRVIATWIAGQTGALAICVFLFRSQVLRLRQSGVSSEIAATWLRSSIFHYGEDHLSAFVWTKTLRLFRYFFSQGTIGLLGFGLFVFAIVMLLRSENPADSKPFQRKLAILLALPFLITLALAIAGIYPYGGTRHDVLLSIFALPGIAIGLDRLPITHRTAAARFMKPLLLGAAMLICNLFPSPSGPYIRPGNQRRELMQQAMVYLRSQPTDAVLFTDAQGSMVLNYYLCDEAMALPFTPEDSLLKLRCGNYYVLTSAATQAGFDRDSFPALLANAWQMAPKETTLYLFQSGWIDDKEEDWIAELRGLGGNPHNFGPNVLLCTIQRPKTTPMLPSSARSR